MFKRSKSKGLLLIVRTTSRISTQKSKVGFYGKKIVREKKKREKKGRRLAHREGRTRSLQIAFFKHS